MTEPLTSPSHRMLKGALSVTLSLVLVTGLLPSNLAFATPEEATANAADQISAAAAADGLLTCLTDVPELSCPPEGTVAVEGQEFVQREDDSARTRLAGYQADGGVDSTIEASNAPGLSEQARQRSEAIAALGLDDGQAILPLSSGSWQGFSWSLQGGTLTVSGSGEMPQRTSDNAPGYVQYASQITKIVIGSGITKVGEADFLGFGNVTTVTLPATLKTIGTAAFADCPALTQVDMPSQVATIEAYVFQDSGLASVTVPASVKSLDSLAFFGSKKLKTISVASSNPNYKSVDGVVYSKDGTVLHMSPVGKTGTLVLPSTVTSIGPDACLDSSLTAVQFPAKLKKIGAGAFSRSMLTSVTFPNSLTDLGEYSFDNCRQLTTVNMGSGVKTIPYRVFQNCTNLANLNLGSVTEIGQGAFTYCTSLRQITFPKGFHTVGVAAFGGCTNVEKVTLPSTIRVLAFQAFSGCTRLSSVSLPQGLDKIYGQAFWNTGITSVSIPSSVTEIGVDAFPSNAKISGVSNLEKLEDGTYMQTAKVAVKGKKLYSEAFAVLDLVNAERKKSGLAPLKMDKELLDAAMRRAPELVLYFDHERPTGQSCFSASSKMNRENIAAGQGTPAAVMNSWMNSSGHKANILSNSTGIGIGCFEHEGVRYWVQCFTSSSTDVASKSSYKDASATPTIAVAQDKDHYRPTITFSKTSLNKGQTAQISVRWNNNWINVPLSPTALRYTTSNSKVIAVSSSGVITGKGAGTAAVKAYFPGYEKGGVSKSIKVSVAKASIAKATVSVASTLPYSGKALRPAVTVKLAGKTLKAGTDYTVAYKSNVGSAKAGSTAKATVTVTGKGSYTGAVSKAFQVKTPSVQYHVHRQTYGWEAKYSKRDGASSGTTGQRKRLEGIYVRLANKPVSGSIQYRTHVQRQGWEKGWRSEGQMSGTTGKRYRLEAIQVRLTGEMAKRYDVYYRVHAQKLGWMGWAKNGASAGTAGYAYRLESVQIKLVPKGGAAPTSAGGVASTKGKAAFSEKK